MWPKVNEKLSLRGLVKILWVLCCVVVLVWWYYAFGLKTGLSAMLKAESQIYLIIWMVILTFPVGLIWVYLMALVLYGLETLGVNQEALSSDVLILWAGFVILGYLQWFKLVPFLIGKWRKKCGQTN